jgi:transglutaminase-like putative cysteine protease
MTDGAMGDTCGVRVGCEFSFELPSPVHVVLQVEPRPDVVLATSTPILVSDPVVPIRRYQDSFGNVCRRMDLSPGPASIHFEAEVLTDARPDPVVPEAIQHPVTELPDDVLQFTLASRYCQSDLLANTAWRLFGDVQGGWARAQAVTQWVNANISWVAGSSHTSTSATDVYLRREGVCRDYAQLAISFLRALNIPARYCFGYLPDIGVQASGEPMDFAAWLEAYIGGRWYTFDPRNNMPRIGRVIIGRGRDALDVAMLTSYGNVPLLGLRVAAEPVSAAPWASADPPVLGAFAVPVS